MAGAVVVGAPDTISGNYLYPVGPLEPDYDGWVLWIKTDPEDPTHYLDFRRPA